MDDFARNCIFENEWYLIWCAGAHMSLIVVSLPKYPKKRCGACVVDDIINKCKGK